MSASTFIAKKRPEGPCLSFVGSYEVDPCLPHVCQVCEWDHDEHERFRVGDVFESVPGAFARTDLSYRWRVESLERGGRAVLRSVATEWATTIPLTWAEQIDGGRFRLVERGTS